MNDLKVKEAIKYTIAGKMKLTRCFICGETWFISANDANVLKDSFVCNRCFIKMQRILPSIRQYVNEVKREGSK